MADVDVTSQVHESCRALAVSLFNRLDHSAGVQEEKRSYNKDYALHKKLNGIASMQRDICDNYMKCKHEQVDLVVQEQRRLHNPTSLWPPVWKLTAIKASVTQE